MSKRIHLEADVLDIPAAKAFILDKLPPDSKLRGLVEGAEMTDNGLVVKWGPFRGLLSFPDAAPPG